MENLLPKSETMSIIELMYNCLPPENITDGQKTVDLRKIDELETILESSYDQVDFYLAVEAMKSIHVELKDMIQVRSIRLLALRVEEAIESAEKRVCSECAGSGDLLSQNNPNTRICDNCSGVGIL